MKRTAVIKKVRTEAKKRGLSFDMVEMTRHTGLIVDGLRSTLGRHTEVDDVTAGKFFDQFAEKFGKGWWR